MKQKQINQNCKEFKLRDIYDVRKLYIPSEDKVVEIIEVKQ